MEIHQGLRADIKCLPVILRKGEEMSEEMAVVYRSGRRNRASSMSFARNLTILPLCRDHTHTYTRTLLQEDIQGFMSVEFQW